MLGHEFAAEIVDYGLDTVRALPVGSAVCGPPIGFGWQGGGTVGYTPAFPDGFGEYMILEPGEQGRHAKTVTDPSLVAG